MGRWIDRCENVYVCMYVCVYVCMCVCIYMYIYIYIYKDLVCCVASVMVYERKYTA